MMVEYEGEVVSIAFGGKGIVRQEGLVVFIPFVAPGERIRYRIVKQHKSYAEGELLLVLDPSPARVKPPCRYFGSCGGCQLQHLTYPEQVRQKQQFAETALARIGGLPQLGMPMVEANTVLEYRRHIRLTLRPEKGRYRAGYVATNGEELLPIQQCPLFSGALAPFCTEVEKIPLVKGTAHLALYKNGDRLILGYEFSQKSPPKLEEIARQQLASNRQIQGIYIRSRRGTNCFGEITGNFAFDGLQIQFTPLAFLQNHPEQSAAIYRQVASLAGRRVLDLYCGIGMMSLLLAKQGAMVKGVESNPEAIRLAQKNAKENRLTAVQFSCRDVVKGLSSLLKERWETVIINPPRGGLDEEVRHQLFQSGIKQVIYISCMPSTLARDVAYAALQGYEVGFRSGYDMFPQTTHLECVVELRAPARGDRR